MDSRFREATPADFDRLLTLYAQLHPDDPKQPGNEVRHVFEQILRAENLHLFVLEDGRGRVQATCYLNVIPNLSRGATPYGILENVVTDEAARGRGFGKRMTLQALQSAWQRGCYKVMLLSGSRRGSVHDFYRACGFDADEKRGFVARRPQPSAGR